MHTLSIRLKYLRSREALAVILLPAVIVWRWWDRSGDIAWSLRISALALLAYILVQGVLYWHLKLRSLEDQTPLPSYFYVVFRGFKWSNLIAIGTLLTVLLLIDRNSVSEADIGWSAALLAGAVLEQINYYHYPIDVRHARVHRPLATQWSTAQSGTWNRYCPVWFKNRAHTRCVGPLYCLRAETIQLATRG